MKTKTKVIALLLTLTASAQAIDWTTTLHCVIIGGCRNGIPTTYLWDCLEGVPPPNCDSVAPPITIGPCGVWKIAFIDYWHGVQCPPNSCITYHQWMNNGHGGQVIVASWQACPIGTCERGYTSSGNALCVAPFCPGPLPSPTVNPGPGFSAEEFDQIWNDPTIPTIYVIHDHSDSKLPNELSN